ncbi:SDR family oxidoreductase [Halioglobus maricola]|uniref:SDR family oxidoreductase n=1 Tax=Halioglobus maricola TaxID=2601894 RepID=A0A5P9NF19_9GAMM|nr:SDR family oxidoreductase [Halioglobus maricola]QFU74342.1 SDR family oxidoreductase [Halioglobus maricola]
MDRNFKDKTIIITGASAGVGADCARAFADAGANLVLAARGPEALANIETELSSRCKVLTVAMDVADDNACVELLQRAQDHFGSVDVLINNAGMHARGDVEKVSGSDMASMVDVNLRAPLFLTNAALPYMRKAGGGAIVMVGSLAGRTPMQGAATYSATKAGLRAFTYGVHDELRGSGIHVGVVSPGPIDTGFIMDEIDLVEDIVFSQPMSTAEEVAEAVLSVANGEQVEICLPASSGRLTTLSYLFAGLRRKMRPRLYEMGRRNKEKYRQRG